MKLVGKAFDIMGDAASTYRPACRPIMQNREISKIEKKLLIKQIKDRQQKAGKTPLNLKKKKKLPLTRLKRNMLIRNLRQL